MGTSQGSSHILITSIIVTSPYHYHLDHLIQSVFCLLHPLLLPHHLSYHSSTTATAASSSAITWVVAVVTIASLAILHLLHHHIHPHLPTHHHRSLRTIVVTILIVIWVFQPYWFQFHHLHHHHLSHVASLASVTSFTMMITCFDWLTMPFLVANSILHLDVVVMVVTTSIAYYEHMNWIPWIY